MKKSIPLLFAWLLVYVSYGRAEVINRIIATVDDEPITLYELRAFSSFAGQRGSPMTPEGMGNMSDRDLLDMLVMNKLVDKEVEAQGLKAKESDIDSYIERIKAQGKMHADGRLPQASVQGYRAGAVGQPRNWLTRQRHAPGHRAVL